MKKRAAMVIAAGLVAALLAGTVAFTMGFAGPQSTAGTTAAVAPIVRTTHHTVTVHRHARATAAPVIRTARGARLGLGAALELVRGRRRIRGRG